MARAESPGDFVAAMGLSASDGTVRTQASVRVALAPIGHGDYAAAMRAPVQAQMGSVRQCFAEGMVRTAAVEGRAVFELEAEARGKVKVTVAKDETGDTAMVDCMRGALSKATVDGVPAGGRALVSLMLSNPTAKIRDAMRTRAKDAVSVRMLEGGKAEAAGATQQGEVKFAVRGSAYASEVLAEMHQDASGRLAGLLDCRRKASKRNRPAEGTITLDVELKDGKVQRVSTANNGVNDRSAPQCVTKWLNRAELASAGTAQLSVDVTFTP